MEDLVATERDLLYMIADLGNPTGSALEDEVDKYYDDAPSRASVYSNLNSLAERGLVDVSQRDKRANSYTLTDDGREEIREHMEWKSQYFPGNDETGDLLEQEKT